MDVATLVARIAPAFAAQDIDAHTAALLLAPSGPYASLSAWNDRIDTLLASAISSSVATPREAAMHGVRFALSGVLLDLRTGFAQACRRELAREPMPPAACMWDEERFLIGVAAGIGAAAPDLCRPLCDRIKARASSPSPRQRIIDVWAQLLARGLRVFDEESARSGYTILGELAAGRLQLAEEDRIAALWLASQLLDASWKPSGQDVANLIQIFQVLRQSLATTLNPDALSTLDCAFLISASVQSPMQTLVRQDVVDHVLAVIEHFPAAAQVMRTRQRGRPPFSIIDEYDVQDLFRALALHVVPDLVPEDPAAKVAGRSSRLDFVSRQARLGFELKHLKNVGDLQRVRADILIDEATYQEHPYLEQVIVFVSDPDRHLPLPDRPAFEADLSKTISIGGRTITYFTRVR